MYYELVSQGLRVVSNKVNPKRMSRDHARRLNHRLRRFTSLRWVPYHVVEELGFERPARSSLDEAGQLACR